MPGDHNNVPPIAVDVMGGDFGPGVIIDGAVQAVEQLGIDVILVGREDEIRSHIDRSPSAAKSFLASNRLKIQQASDVITMEDSPSRAIRLKPDASIRRAFELMKKSEASAVVSPGNTGAMMAAGLFVSRTLSGIARPAIATLIPRTGGLPPVVFLDSGANVECHASQLVQFAIMGNFYSQTALEISKPRIALLSNGTESSKGTDIIRASAHCLKEMEELRFVGYVEGRDIAKDVADVVVCDGFTGNVVLKTMEGSVDLVVSSIKESVLESPLAKFGMWLAKPTLKRLFTEKLDPSAYGGAPLLGLNGIGIVCHGSSREKAILNAVRVAQRLASDNLVGRLECALAQFEQRSPDELQSSMWNGVEHPFSKNESDRRKDGVQSSSGSSE